MATRALHSRIGVVYIVLRRVDQPAAPNPHSGRSLLIPVGKARRMSRGRPHRALHFRIGLARARAHPVLHFEPDFRTPGPWFRRLRFPVLPHDSVLREDPYSPQVFDEPVKKPCCQAYQQHTGLILHAKRLQAVLDYRHQNDARPKSDPRKVRLPATATVFTATVITGQEGYSPRMGWFRCQFCRGKEGPSVPLPTRGKKTPQPQLSTFGSVFYKSRCVRWRELIETVRGPSCGGALLCWASCVPRDVSGNASCVGRKIEKRASLRQTEVPEKVIPVPQFSQTAANRQLRKPMHEGANGEGSWTCGPPCRSVSWS